MQRRAELDLLDPERRDMGEDRVAGFADAERPIRQFDPRAARIRASRTAMLSCTRDTYAVGTR
jgi:hypothetical protein